MMTITPAITPYAHAENLLSQSARFLLKPNEARALTDSMEETVRKRWYEICRREGVSEKDCDTIRPAFAYEGFGLVPDESVPAPGVEPGTF